MKKNKPIFSKLVIGGVFFLAITLLANFNLEKTYRPGEYVASENAYFVEKVDSEAGLVKAKKFVTPTDNTYSTQKTRSLGTNLIGDIESVWDSYTGEGTTIAIIDDGFDYNHPEFTRTDGTSAILSTSRYYYMSGNKVYYQEYSSNPSVIGQDWESDGDGGYEWSTHGTATSTTAAAPMNNGGGVGIAPNANILALKIDFYLSSIGAAMDYAISQNVDVINMSLGAYAENFTDGWGDKQTGLASTATELNAVSLRAYNAGIIVVAAAGNEATYRKSYPASNTKVIGVGAIGDWDSKGNPTELAEFTNYVGASQTGEVNVDILAPGYVYTAHQMGTQSNPTHTYADTQGTSFSSPIVAGAAALWKQKHPNGTPDQFLTELQSTADGIGSYTNKMIPVSGWDSALSDVGPSNITNGRLNVAKLLDIDSPHVTTKQSSLNISVGESRQIALDTYNGTISYTSNNSSIATVNSSGLVSGVSAGNTSITVTAKKTGKPDASATVAVTVAPIVATTSIVFNPSTKTLNVGETYSAELTIVVTPSNASRIFLFESFNEDVATVDIDTGLVTAIGVGTAEIYALSIYGDSEDILTITVENALPQNGVVNFGNAAGKLNVTSTNVTGTDNLNNSWTVTTTGTTSFTPNAAYSQIGSAKNPASTIEFKMTLSSSVTFTSVSASFGGFSGTSAAVIIKVGSTSIGTGNVPDNAEVTVTNTSTASGNVLIIYLNNISKGIKAFSISYSYTGGEVTPPDPEPEPTLTSVNVINTKIYHPGETISKSDITVKLTYSDGAILTTTNFSFNDDDYLFTYEDANSGGTNTTKQFVIIYEGTSYPFSVNVNRNAYQSTTGETTIISSSELNSSNISKNSSTSSPISVTISGVAFTVTTNAYIYNGNLSFGKTAGHIYNTYAFGSDLSSITISQKSDSRKDGVLEISKDGTTWVNHSASELAKGGYRYFKYKYVGTVSGSGASTYSNVQSISYTLSGQDNPTSVANYIMYEDTADQCLTKLPEALEKLNNMSNANMETFWTSDDYVISTARERITAWARATGQQLSYNSGSFQINSTNNRFVFTNDSVLPDTKVVIFITLFGLLTISGYFFIKRKQEN